MPGLNLHPAAEAWLRAQEPEHRRFRDACAKPEEAQWERLSSIVAANADTDFGRAHDFAGIRSPADFAERAPPGNHAANAQPWLARMKAPNDGVLTKAPVQFFERTSGTSGAAKLIPFTARLRQEVSRAVAAWMGGLLAERPGSFAGPAYWALSPPLMESHPSVAGVRVGNLDDLDYFPPRSAALLRRWLVMNRGGSFDSAETFYDHTLDRLLAHRDLSFVSVWSPTFFLNLDRRLGERLGRSFTWTEVWPRLATLSCWTDAGSARWLQETKSRLGVGAAVQGKGLMATEGVTGVPYPGGTPALAVRSHFYEFREKHSGRWRLAHELKPGTPYEVALTTGGGLYRYLTGDLVEVTGYLDKAPRLRFLGRLGDAVDLVGEKLNERQAAEALNGLGGFIVPQTDSTGYLLCVETANLENGTKALLARVEDSLSANPYYAQARKLKQLAPLSLRVLPEGFTLRLAGKWAERRGSREGEVKLPALFQPGEVDDLLPS